MSRPGAGGAPPDPRRSAFPDRARAARRPDAPVRCGRGPAPAPSVEAAPGRPGRSPSPGRPSAVRRSASRPRPRARGRGRAARRRLRRAPRPRSRRTIPGRAARRGPRSGRWSRRRPGARPRGRGFPPAVCAERRCARGCGRAGCRRAGRRGSPAGVVELPGDSSSSRSPLPGSLSCQRPRRFSTRRRSVTPARARARSGVSKYVDVSVRGSSGSPGRAGSEKPGGTESFSSRSRVVRGRATVGS